MTRCKDDNMTRRQDDKSYQMLPKISKTARKKLPKVGKHCQTLPNLAKSSQQVSKVVNIKNPNIATSCQKMPWVSNLWQTLEQFDRKKLIRIAENWQKVANGTKSSQKMPKVSNCWQKLSKAAKICQKLATRHDDMVT